MFARVYLTIRSTKLPCEDRRGRSTRHRAKKMHRYIGGSIERERERSLESHDEGSVQRLVRTTDGPLRAFRLPTLSLPSLSRGRKIYESVCTRMRTVHDCNHAGKCILENKRRERAQWLPSPERETTNRASLYSPYSRGNDFLTENYSIKLGDNGVKQMNYYCPCYRSLKL